VSRKLAILDDNQRILESRLRRLAVELPRLVEQRVRAAMVIGSVAAGRARDTSDIDVVLLLRGGEPVRAHYRWWEREVAPALAVDDRFPVQPLFVAQTALRTTEPNLRAALASGIRLWDPERLFDDQPESRA